ncbi:tetratricopeptide repeat protein [Thermincola potens]|uniref:TPR repeat-containing protein n=1 Tax=Thermincola potens (strain JR) TaxID=635013 RepID=D5XE14_THEPJ|nr:tetratricopeptide repeat protein [Thermincola potens]ADG81885.1 TPR repeat-containing protein [Thermincola potens JR]
MEGRYSNEIPFTKALTIFAVIAIVIFALGIGIGEMFFWDQYETINPLDKEIEYYKGIVARQKDNDNALVELGWRYYRKGDYQQAVKNLEEAVRINDSNPAAHFNLALSYKEIGLLEKAEEEFNKVLQISPDHKLAPFYMGKMYFEQNRYDDAIKQLVKATELDPASADASYLLGQAYQAKGYNEEALAAYERALELVPGHSEAKEAYYKLQAQVKKK